VLSRWPRSDQPRACAGRKERRRDDVMISQLIWILILLILVIGAFAIVQWGIRASGVVIPQPIYILGVVIIAIVCLLIILHLLSGGLGHLPTVR
jgi:hypothetical protein